MVHFIGAGPGAEDLITVRGAKLLGEADVIIYAGSLVNPALLNYKKESCAVYDSASMTLEQVIEVMRDTEARGGMTVRLHTGDPSLYGAIREQMDELDKLGVGYDVTPGVSSFSGAAAALCAEYTLPEVSQSVIITRMAGRTPVPEGEELRKMASHGCTMVLFLSTGLLEQVEEELLAGGYTVSGPKGLVEEYIRGKRLLGVDTLGGLLSAHLQGTPDRAALPQGLELSPLDLQKLFVLMTSDPEQTIAGSPRT